MKQAPCIGCERTDGTHAATCFAVEPVSVAPARRSITPFAPFEAIRPPPLEAIDREAPTRPENLPPPTIADVLAAVWKVGADVVSLTASVSACFKAVQEVPILRAKIESLEERVAVLERRPTAAE